MYVNDLTSGSSFKKKIGFTAVAIVLLHIVLTFFLLFAPKKIVHSNPLSSLYSQLFLLGPFFGESRIKTSSHLYVRYKVNNEWSPPRDYGMENFKFYRQHPWRYDKLHLSDFEKYVTDHITQQKRYQPAADIEKSKLFLELNQFLLSERIQKPVDSVCLTYGANVYLPETATVRFDTIFSLTYNPNTIAASKK